MGGQVCVGMVVEGDGGGGGLLSRYTVGSEVYREGA